MSHLQMLIFAVDDVARSLAFYTAAFGWPVRMQVPGVIAELTVSDHLGLAVYQREGFARNTGRPTAPVPAAHTTATELYLRVDSADALTDAIDTLTRAGATLLSPRADRTWGDEAAYFADPDGNVVAVARTLPQT